MKCIRMLTFLTLDEIDDMETWADNRINEKKEILAYELTKLVHGAEEADKAKTAAYALFSGAGDDSNMPTTEIPAAEAADGMNIIDLMVRCALCASKGEARRLIQQGGVSVDGEKITDIGAVVSADALRAGAKIRKGKKVFHKAILA